MSRPDCAAEASRLGMGQANPSHRDALHAQRFFRLRIRIRDVNACFHSALRLDELVAAQQQHCNFQCRPLEVVLDVLQRGLNFFFESTNFIRRYNSKRWSVRSSQILVLINGRLYL